MTTSTPPGEPSPERETLRRSMREVRRSVDDATRREAAERLGMHLLDLEELRGPGRLATYLPTDGEIDPNVALDRWRSRGWVVHLPVVDPDAGRVDMRFVEWDPNAPTRPNRFGIMEPVRIAPPRAADELDVVILPCVAVDGDGNRLGFGAGYYDRALAGSDACRIATVLDLQVVPEVTAAPWDVPVDVVVTEARTVRVRH